MGALTPAFAQPAPRPPGPIKHDVVADDGHHLTVWQRRGALPRATRILLIHGRTWSSLPNFDLRVPGEERSFMEALGTAGLDVFALDLRGYGSTPRDASGFLTPDRAVADVAAVVSWMQQQDARKGGTYVFGLSRGAMIAAMTAQKHPEKVAGIVLLGFGFDPDVRAAPSDPGVRPGRVRNTSDAAISDFITRDAYTGATMSAFVRAALQTDPVLADWRDEQQFNAFVPARVQVPVLLVHGDRDPQAPMSIGTKLFNRFGTPDKWWIILPGADHAAHLEKSAPLLVRTVVNFTRRHETGRP
ncbi:MAG TPA: alpha/beta fold hydrolase [Vicinamibacterales bacterium]|nr:alpha/beta fold hydrolase [Vicinamibacterales bacterium]